MAVASQPGLYDTVQLALPTLIGLLQHENDDIAIDVIKLFNEWTDVDVVNSNQNVTRLVHKMVEYLQPQPSLISSITAKTFSR